MTGTEEVEAVGEGAEVKDLRLFSQRQGEAAEETALGIVDLHLYPGTGPEAEAARAGIGKGRKKEAVAGTGEGRIGIIEPVDAPGAGAEHEVRAAAPVIDRPVDLAAQPGGAGLPFDEQMEGIGGAHHAQVAAQVAVEQDIAITGGGHEVFGPVPVDVACPDSAVTGKDIVADVEEGIVKQLKEGRTRAAVVAVKFQSACTFCNEEVAEAIAAHIHRPDIIPRSHRNIEHFALCSIEYRASALVAGPGKSLLAAFAKAHYIVRPRTIAEPCLLRIQLADAGDVKGTFCIKVGQARRAQVPKLINARITCPLLRDARAEEVQHLPAIALPLCYEGNGTFADVHHGVLEEIAFAKAETAICLPFPCADAGREVDRAAQVEVCIGAHEDVLPAVLIDIGGKGGREDNRGRAPGRGPGIAVAQEAGTVGVALVFQIGQAVALFLPDDDFHIAIAVLIVDEEGFASRMLHAAGNIGTGLFVKSKEAAVTFAEAPPKEVFGDKVKAAAPRIGAAVAVEADVFARGKVVDEEVKVAVTVDVFDGGVVGFVDLDVDLPAAALAAQGVGEQRPVAGSSLLIDFETEDGMGEEVLVAVAVDVTEEDEAFQIGREAVLVFWRVAVALSSGEVAEEACGDAVIDDQVLLAVAVEVHLVELRAVESPGEGIGQDVSLAAHDDGGVHTHEPLAAGREAEAKEDAVK